MIYSPSARASLIRVSLMRNGSGRKGRNSLEVRYFCLYTVSRHDAHEMPEIFAFPRCFGFDTPAPQYFSPQPRSNGEHLSRALFILVDC